MTKSGYTVHVLSDCITSYDKRKLPEMLAYRVNSFRTNGQNKSDQLFTVDRLGDLVVVIRL